MKNKYKYTVSIDFYIKGSGYSYTVAFDSGFTSDILTAESWYNDFLDNGGDELFDHEEEWINIRVKCYSEDSDPTFDDPISESEYEP